MFYTSAGDHRFGKCKLVMTVQTGMGRKECDSHPRVIAQSYESTFRLDADGQSISHGASTSNRHVWSGDSGGQTDCHGGSVNTTPPWGDYT